MYCPNCKSEYVEGIKECPECKISLVEGIPEDAENILISPSELVTVFASYDIGTIAIVKSILQAEGLDFYAKGENIQNLFSFGSVGLVEILVRPEEERIARELLKELTDGE